MSEIKTCEEYVLNRINELDHENYVLNDRIEALEKINKNLKDIVESNPVTENNQVTICDKPTIVWIANVIDLTYTYRLFEILKKSNLTPEFVHEASTDPEKFEKLKTLCADGYDIISINRQDVDKVIESVPSNHLHSKYKKSYTTIKMCVTYVNVNIYYVYNSFDATDESFLFFTEKEAEEYVGDMLCLQLVKFNENYGKIMEEWNKEKEKK